MRGLGALDALGIAQELRFEGPCSIPGQLFDLGPYPALRPGPGHVAGELFRIESPAVLAKLDEFEGFEPTRPRESLYRRVSIRLIEPVDCIAWIYVYNHQPAPDRLIPHGDWRAQLDARR